MYPINEVENGSIIKTYSWLGSKLRGIVSDKTYIFDYNARGIRERKLVRNGNVPISDIYYFYDSQNRLVGESRYEYIGTGQKTKTSDIIYIYDATGLLYGFRYNGVEYYYDRDILGNINHIIHNNGLIVATYKYEAYGKHKVLNASGVEVLNSTFIGNINPIRYKGYYYDVETQLYWVSSRYYSPELCRWISPDSIEYLDPESINGLNLYAYCGNDPINKYDPTGHFAISTLVLIALGIFVIDTVIETTILMTSEEYKAENVYHFNPSTGEGNVHIPNSAAFNNPIAQLIYSIYLYENVKMEDGSNFFTGDPYDIVGELQAHNIAASFTRTLMALFFVPLALLSNGDYFWNIMHNLYVRSAHVDLGPSIAAEDDWYVRLPSYILKWIIKILSFNSLEW